MSQRCAIALALLALTLCGAPVASATVRYGMIDLGGLGEPGVYPTAINAAGQIAGWCYTLPYAYPHAFSYSAGTIADLGTLGGNPPLQDSEANGISQSGQIVGWSWNASNVSRAFSYSDGTMHDLGTLGGSTAIAYGVNDAGQIVGMSAVVGGDSPPQHAFLYDAGTMHDLGTLGGSASQAFGINNAGQIVGSSGYSGGGYHSHAFLYSDGTMRDLGTLGTDADSWASAINDHGQVAGTSYASGSSYTAFLYSGGTMQGLGTLGGSLSYAYSLNNSGQVVGYYYSPSMTNVTYGHAFLYSGGTMTDLNGLVGPALGATLEWATAINDQGWIVGTWHPATDIYRYSRGYLLVPLPAGASQTGDANLDGRVDINDLSVVLANYDKTKGMSWGSGDFNGDGKVDINDLNALLACYGQSIWPSAPAAVAAPEPSSLALLGIACAGLLRFARRRTP